MPRRCRRVRVMAPSPESAIAEVFRSRREASFEEQNPDSLNGTGFYAFDFRNSKLATDSITIIGIKPNLDTQIPGQFHLLQGLQIIQAVVKRLQL